MKIFILLALLAGLIPVHSLCQYSVRHYNVGVNIDYYEKFNNTPVRETTVMSMYNGYIFVNFTIDGHDFELMFVDPSIATSNQYYFMILRKDGESRAYNVTESSYKTFTPRYYKSDHNMLWNI
jgi:hypothetical protein